MYKVLDGMLDFCNYSLHSPKAQAFLLPFYRCENSDGEREAMWGDTAVVSRLLLPS